MPQAALRRDKRMSFGGGTIVAEPDTLPRSTCVFETRHTAQNFIFVEDVILDAETRRSIAIIRNGQVSAVTRRGRRLRSSYLRYPRIRWLRVHRRQTAGREDEKVLRGPGFCSASAFAIFRYALRSLSSATTVSMVTPATPFSKSSRLHALPSRRHNSFAIFSASPVNSRLCSRIKLPR
jgi:hypothetical protein